MTLTEAAHLKGVSWQSIFYYIKRFPHLFTRDGAKWDITPGNLGQLPIRAKVRKGQPARPLNLPGESAPAKPSTKSMECQVGWWCRRCKACLPMGNRLCSCLDGSERPAQVAAFRNVAWTPMYVRLTVTLGARP